ncbi:MAG: phenylalanine--tRNA ligase subunit beta [Verrucomicrobia bacterium]|nr:phenylalanine--tRNA ligase subunit beta [Verrucomicrobiota bacterium]
MKVTLNWLRQYVEFDWSPEQLAERLTMLGLEVEGVEKISGEFEGIVVAQILTRDKVPASDKLSVCRVNDGQGERTIICGAQNHQPGDKVPLILPNFALPMKPGDKEPFVIKERKVFGITSQGMMCSPQELGLPDQIDGLLILPADAPVGKPFAEYLGRSGGDVVLDLEVTPNRPDLNSVLGIAREIAAVTGNKLKRPSTELHASRLTQHAADLVAVRIEDPELCPRYTARIVKGVKIGPSPDWLRLMLERVGIRSINNVVDVTNYVMLECGQPLHAFDYHLIVGSRRGNEADASANPPPHVGGYDGKPTIVVRRAAVGEKFKTLDNQERTLTSNMLLIADEQKGIALAGVMGGANTEINDQTVDVLIESAYFSPTNIRRTSKALGLRSESSYRFERGADIGICDWASQRAAQLILETAGGQLAEGVVDACPHPAEAKQVMLRYAKTNELLGITIAHTDQVNYLTMLGLEATAQTNDTCAFRIPTWRVDLKRETDLIEEIERLHGLEKVPATPPRGAIGTNAFDAIHDQIAEVRRILSGLGLNEAQGQTLISDTAAKLTAPMESLVPLANPLSSDMNVLRPSLLPGLLESLRHNVTHKNYDVALFEVGRVFRNANNATRAAKEERHIAIALTGKRQPGFWSGEEREAKFELTDLKGFVEELLEQFGVRGVTFTARTENPELFLESAVIALGGKLPLGELGLFSPRLAKQYDLRDAVLLAELSLNQLIARRNPAKSFKPLPQFPAIRRDVAMLVPESVTHDAVLQAVRKAKPANLEGVELFDVFRGQHVSAGQKSLAYAFVYRHAARTLTDAEVNTAHTQLVEHLRQKLAAVIR